MSLYAVNVSVVAVVVGSTLKKKGRSIHFNFTVLLVGERDVRVSCGVN